MSLAEWILIVTLAASFYNIGVIWMVQISYRLWAYVRAEEFPTYHTVWWSGLGGMGIQPVIFPAAGLTTIGSIALFWIRPPMVPLAAVWLALGIQVLIWGLTAIMWAPWQAKLHTVLARRSDGSLSPLYLQLLTTHWIRVGLISAYGLVVFWMTVTSITQ